MQIHAIPAFEDNYFWLIQPDTQHAEAYVIDPGLAEPIYRALRSHGLTLAGVLITHHHHDHIDGAAELGQTFKVPIYGPQSTKIPQVTHVVKEHDLLLLRSLCAHVIEIPGHTRDHIGYFIPDDQSATASQPPLLFCGDTLFAAGCGRLFDGSAEQLFQSLQRITTLPEHTLIYCAHEYTLSNLRFALHIEPDNAALIGRRTAVMNTRELNLPSIPNSLALEKQTNPFLRCHLRHVHRRVEQLTGLTVKTELEVFTLLRRLKDHF